MAPGDAACCQMASTSKLVNFLYLKLRNCNTSTAEYKQVLLPRNVLVVVVVVVVGVVVGGSSSSNT